MIARLPKHGIVIRKLMTSMLFIEVFFIEKLDMKSQNYGVAEKVII